MLTKQGTYFIMMTEYLRDNVLCRCRGLGRGGIKHYYVTNDLRTFSILRYSYCCPHGLTCLLQSLAASTINKCPSTRTRSKSEFGKVHPRRDVTGTPDAIRVRIPRWVPQYGAGVGDSGLAETLYSPPVPSEGPCRSLRPCPINFYE